MSQPVRLLPEARAEFDAATDWYEARRAGQGLDFVARVRETLARIAANPQRQAPVYLDIRKARVAGYPYVVLYREEPGEVVVISVFHTSRDPAIWRSRA